ncbi:MAG: energy-coupling factor transporter ATPase [Clostridia bacterium]
MSIVIENLSFTYSPKSPYEHKALDNLSVTIDDGEFMGIIGPTGSGKSTLIQHLNGLIKLTSGQITVNGIKLHQKPDLKKLRATVGMVFQYPEYQLFDETVAKDVAFGPKNLGLDKDEIDKRVREAIEIVGLNFDEISERSPFELSGGQKRRVAIAGVIAMKPEILILDEPTAGLDPVGRQEMFELIARLKKTTSPTIIMVSHNMDEIAAVATKIAVIYEGKLEYLLKPSELFSHSDRLLEIGLDIPTSVKITNELKKRGIELGETAVTADAFVAQIVNWRREKL